MTTTTNMSIELPTVSTATSYGTPAQDWANMLNVGFNTVDSHDHSNGRGAQIPSSALDYDYLNMAGFGFKNCDGLVFTPLTSQDEDTQPDSLYTFGDDLYYVDDEGDHVRITEAGALVTDGTAGFQGDYGTDGSVATFSGQDHQFIFYGTNSAALANIECGSVTCTSEFNVSQSLSGTPYSETAIGFFTTTESAPNYISGELTRCFSDLTRGNSLSTTDYPAVAYRDEYNGVSIAPDTYNKTGNTGLYDNIAGLNLINTQVNGGVNIGYNRCGDQDAVNNRFETYIEFDVYEAVQNQDGTYGDGWEVNGQTVSKTFTVEEETPSSTSNLSGKTFVFQRKLGFYPTDVGLDSAVPTLYYVQRLPRYKWEETNFGTYKTIKITFQIETIQGRGAEYSGPLVVANSSVMPFSIGIWSIKGVQF